MAEPVKTRSMRPLWLTVGSFVVLGAGYLLYWGVYGRFHENTDDAYVSGNAVVLTPQIPGIITGITAISTDYVSKGRVIVELDPTDAKIEYEKSKAELAQAVRQVAQMYEVVTEYQAKMEVNKAQLLKESEDFERRKALVDDGGVSVESFQHAEARLSAAFFSLVMTEYQYLEALALVEGTTLQTHPLVVQAQEKVRLQFVKLGRCSIKAPVTGVVSQRKAQVGERVEPGTPLMSIVPLEEMWVDANFKEVQLEKMRIGQPAEVTADLYGGSVVYHGKVVGFSGGTGSVFSLLPPQNATGNWIKIVQRLPVKIALDSGELKAHPLRLGLSMNVTVDLHETEGSVVPKENPPVPLYQTDVFAQEEAGAKAVIEEIVKQNTPTSFLEAMKSDDSSSPDGS